MHRGVVGWLDGPSQTGEKFPKEGVAFFCHRFREEQGEVIEIVADGKTAFFVREEVYGCRQAIEAMYAAGRPEG